MTTPSKGRTTSRPKKKDPLAMAPLKINMFPELLRRVEERAKMWQAHPGSVLIAALCDFLGRVGDYQEFRRICDDAYRNYGFGSVAELEEAMVAIGRRPKTEKSRQVDFLKELGV